MDYEQIFSTAIKERVSDGALTPVWPENFSDRVLIVVWPQLGDFDSLEYAWWLTNNLEQIQAQNITIRAVGIGNRASGQRFCDYTGFPHEWLQVDPEAAIHQQLHLYGGLNWKPFGQNQTLNAWFNLMAMCAGIGSPGTLKEVFRGYKGDKKAPQLIADNESIQAKPLPAIKGSLFKLAGGSGFQRPFELATLRLKNMEESLGKWSTYVPDASYLTQRGGTFLFNQERTLLYEHRDRGILGFSDTMANPLEFLNLALTQTSPSIV